MESDWKHSPRQGQRSARRGPLDEDSPIIVGMQIPAGGPGTRCGVSEPHCRSHSAATRGANIVELSVGSAGALFQVPSSSSPWTQRYSVEGEMSSVRMPCSGAVDTITANLRMWCTAGRCAGGKRVILPVPPTPSP